MAGTYTVTTTGFPAAAITETGRCPAGHVVHRQQGRHGTISGTPATGSAGTYPVTITATNASGSTATLALTITVNAAAAPAITSGSSADFTLNQAGRRGHHHHRLADPGAHRDRRPLPAGLTFTDNGNGTALLSGTPTATGTTNLTITASNGISPDATQTVHDRGRPGPGLHQRRQRHGHGRVRAFSFTSRPAATRRRASAGPTCRRA